MEPNVWSFAYIEAIILFAATAGSFSAAIGWDLGKVFSKYLSRRFGNEAYYRVLLESTGLKKINVIKCIRDHTNLGLKEAKEVTDRGDSQTVEIPFKVGRAIPKADAEHFLDELRAAGAQASIKRH